MTETPLALRAINKSFSNRKVLHGLDFTLQRGAVLGLLGKNGAGKSTLLKIALGLLRPDGGEAQVFDEPAWDMSDRAKSRVGYVPQVIAGFGWMRVGELLDYTGAFYANWDGAMTARLLDEWELDPKAKTGKLSEGQKQKLAIIRAMGHDPELLILDEPVASLDPVARRQFLKHLIELNVSAEKTILFSTHITSDIERVAAQIALLKDGALAFQGDLDEIKERVQRLHIHARNDLPESLPIANLLRARVQGAKATAAVRDFNEAQRQFAAQQLNAEITVEALNLEEIFLELHS